MLVRLTDGTVYEGVDRIEKQEGQYFLFFKMFGRWPTAIPTGAIQAILS